jgi:hypothetical protein
MPKQRKAKSMSKKAARKTGSAGRQMDTRTRPSGSPQRRRAVITPEEAAASLDTDSRATAADNRPGVGTGGMPADTAAPVAESGVNLSPAKGRRRK